MEGLYFEGKGGDIEGKRRFRCLDLGEDFEFWIWMCGGGGEGKGGEGKEGKGREERGGREGGKGGGKGKGLAAEIYREARWSFAMKLVDWIFGFLCIFCGSSSLCIRVFVRLGFFAFGLLCV